MRRGLNLEFQCTVLFYKCENPNSKNKVICKSQIIIWVMVCTHNKVSDESYSSTILSNISHNTGKSFSVIFEWNFI